VGVLERRAWIEHINRLDDLPESLRESMRELVIKNDQGLSNALGQIELCYRRTIAHSPCLGLGHKARILRI